jgi:hypothetical protein
MSGDNRLKLSLSLDGALIWLTAFLFWGPRLDYSEMVESQESVFIRIEERGITNFIVCMSPSSRDQ